MTKNRLVDDCFQASESLISHDAAIAELKSRTHAVTGAGDVAVDLAAGRILANRVIAQNNVPGHDNAAVDGYAFLHNDLTAKSESVSFEVIGRSAAGRPFTGQMKSGAAVRIFTGAVVPEGCDSVVMQEDVDATEGQGRVAIPATARQGANIRPVGEDVKSGDALFEMGHLLRPQDLASLASIGISAVTCFDRLKVGIISTGDEIVTASGTPLEPGKVYDANRPMLQTLVEYAGCKAHDLGIWPDDLADVKRRFDEASKTYDVLITSGGASQGEEDHIAAALNAIGQRHFWRIAVKPGRPLMFGQVANVPVIGLPGNPVAVFVCFLMYVFPLLRRLGGSPWLEPQRIPLRAAFDVPRRKPGRREFWRGSLLQTSDGVVADKYPKDGSGLISSLRLANGLIDMPEDVPSVKKGDTIAFLPFSQFGILD